MTEASSLRGMRVAILESRMGTELASLVERSSGVPYCVPAVRQVDRDRRAEVEQAIAWLDSSERRVVVLLNGAAVEAIFRVAAALGREEALHAGLGRAAIVCRGPKPIAALKKRGLTATVRAAEPFTTREVVEALDGIPLRGCEALVLHYGERNPVVVNALARAHATVRELSLYEWELPVDLEPLERLVEEIVDGRVGIVAFTSQIQARNLVAVAERVHKKQQLVDALSERTIVAAIGPTCADALRALGIPPRVMPEQPKMGPLVQSLARFLSEKRPG